MTIQPRQPQSFSRTLAELRRLADFAAKDLPQVLSALDRRSLTEWLARSCNGACSTAQRSSAFRSWEMVEKLALIRLIQQADAREAARLRREVR